MSRHFVFLSLLALAAPLSAQDRVTLSSGDVLTGKVKTMAGDVLTLVNPDLGDVAVPMAKIHNLWTQEPVRLLTKQGELLRRRIAGIEDGQLKLGGGGEGAPSVQSMSLDNLGQINPEPKEPVNWTGSLQLAANWVSGNTDRRSTGLSLEAERRTDADRISVDAAWDYAEEKSQLQEWNLTQRRAGSGLQYDYFLDERWYTLATTRVLGDTLADIDLRYTAGLGLGHQVLDSPTESLLVETGLSYVNENYLSATPSIDYLAARIAYKLRYDFNELTRLVHSIEAFPSLQNSDDFYLQASTELQTNLSESMIGSLSWNMDYDNTPSPGLKRVEHRIVLAVGWAF